MVRFKVGCPAVEKGIPRIADRSKGKFRRHFKPCTLWINPRIEIIIKILLENRKVLEFKGFSDCVKLESKQPH